MALSGDDHRKQRKALRVIHAVALKFLAEHYKSHDPFMDDNPTGRVEAAKHIRSCEYCIAFGAWVRGQNAIHVTDVEYDALQRLLNKPTPPNAALREAFARHR